MSLEKVGENQQLVNIENYGLANSRLHVFANLKSGEVQGDSGRRIVEYIKRLSEGDASRQDVQQSISYITREILTSASVKLPHDDILLVPVMRAGIAMWDSANQYFGYPETSFLWGVKEKGTSRASVLWTKKNNVDKHIIILDPVIATGDTILQAQQALVSRSTNIRSLTIIGCYGSPEGIKTILDKTKSVNLFVGCMSETVNADGYLIPPTNGDMGDKLFGSPVE